MMISTLGVLTRIFMIFHVKSTNQRLCNGLYLLIETKRIPAWPNISDRSATPVNAYALSLERIVVQDVDYELDINQKYARNK